MRLRRTKWLASLLILVPAVVLAAPPKTGLLVGDEAIFVAPAVLVAEPTVRFAAWSPNGQAVLAIREVMEVPTSLDTPPAMETSIVLWKRSSARRTVLWKTPLSMGEVRLEVGWLPQSDTALIAADERVALRGPDQPQPGIGTRRVMLHLDASRSRMRMLGTLAPDQKLLISPVAPVAVLWDSTATEEPIKVVGANGNVRRVPTPQDQSIHTVYWTRDGNVVLRYHDSKRRDHRTIIVNLHTGRQMETDEQPAPYVAAVPLQNLRLVNSAAQLAEDNPQTKVKPLWLEGDAAQETTRELITPHGEFGTLAPRADAVLYVAEGAAWAAPLVRFPREAYFQARDAARRAELLSNLKQVGVALIMWSQDYDDRLPDAGEDVHALLGPYLKSKALLAGFVYTFGGGNLKHITNPAETVLGYVSGPGGRANVYADGHVQWLPDPAP